MKKGDRLAVYVTTGEAGRACGVTAGAVKKWIRQGKLRAIRTPGGHFRIPIEEMERLTVCVDASTPKGQRSVQSRSAGRKA